VMMTVLFSIFAHGLSALPGMDLYARKLRSLAPDAPELETSEATGPAHPSTETGSSRH